MCIIVDANMGAMVFCSPAQADYSPILRWLERDGRLVLGGKLTSELYRIGSCRRYLVELARAGRARIVPSEAIATDQQAIQAHCCSNDAHVVALARVSGARTLCSHDQELHRDFKNPELVSNPRGAIYQNATHTDLLRHSVSCGLQR